MQSPPEVANRPAAPPQEIRSLNSWVVTAVAAIVAMAGIYGLIHFVAIPRVDALEDEWDSRNRITRDAVGEIRDIESRAERWFERGDTASLRRLNETLREAMRDLDAMVEAFHDAPEFADSVGPVDTLLVQWVQNARVIRAQRRSTSLAIAPEVAADSSGRLIYASLLSRANRLGERVERAEGRLDWWTDVLYYVSMAVLLVGLFGLLMIMLRFRASLLARLRELAVERERAEAQAQEQLQLQEQLRQSQKMEAVGQLAGGIAHDFNNLLTVITGHVQLMLADTRPQQDKCDLEQIRRAADQAAALTSKLLSFSRKQVLAPTPVDINGMLGLLEPMLRRLLPSDVNLNLRRLTGAPRVLVDPVYIEQVVINLVVNSRDAMPEGGTITIETATDEDPAFRHIRQKLDRDGRRYLVLSISDTGCGMTDDVKAQAFQPFFTTKGVGKGTGLGLATVFGIVKQSGGHLELESEPGKGTRMTIMLPKAAHQVEAPAHPDGELPVSTGSETVLLIDDNVELLRLAKRMLERLQYSVITAENGAEGLALLEERGGEIDVVLTDIVMPEMTGLALLKASRDLEASPPIVLMSGYAGDEMQRRGFEPESVTLLHKPFTHAALARVIREAIDARTLTAVY